MTERKARDLGLAIEERGFVYSQAHSLAEWQRVEVQFVSSMNVSPGEPLTGYTSVGMAWDVPGIDSSLVEALIAGGVLVVSLLIVAIGLSLMAAEGKEERDVLVSVGASPRTLASLAALRAWLLTTCAVLLALPVGLVPVTLVLNAGRSPSSNNYGDVVLPLRTIGFLMLVPFVTYAATHALTTCARLIRPVRMSNFAFD